MRSFAIAASIAALALGWAGPASAQSPIIIKFSHVVATDTPKGKASTMSRFPRPPPRASS